VTVAGGEVGRTRADGDHEVLLTQPTFFANYRSSENGQVRVTITGQYASDTTLSSDLFILGGYGNIRGFQSAETTGEHGIQCSVEYIHKLWSGAWRGRNVVASAGPLLDGGQVWNRIDDSTQDDRLTSVGVGAEIEAAITKFGPTKLRFDFAYPLGNYNSPEVDNISWFLRLGQTF